MPPIEWVSISSKSSDKTSETTLLVGHQIWEATQLLGLKCVWLTKKPYLQKNIGIVECIVESKVFTQMVCCPFAKEPSFSCHFATVFRETNLWPKARSSNGNTDEDSLMATMSKENVPAYLFFFPKRRPLGRGYSKYQQYWRYITHPLLYHVLV